MHRFEANRLSSLELSVVSIWPTIQRVAKNFFQNLSSERLIDWEKPHFVWHESKVASILLLLLVGYGCYWIFTADQFFIYREDVDFINVSYLTQDELYEAAQVDGWSAFWLQPNEIGERLRNHPYVADAQVTILLPGRVEAQIVEEQPKALWITDQGPLWLLADGRALPIRHENTAGLLQIRDGTQAARALRTTDFVDAQVQESQQAIDRDVLTAAENLSQLFPNIQYLNYHKGIGLNFALPHSDYWIYWGDGQNIETKITNLQAAQRILERGDTTAQIIDLRYLQRPYFR
ncbi:FtsQ-type POTRA domain-containing protein [Chloroflexi bacterium TSY]|nr:FtsQ-type POTRA domain-containing protein [Chloroflexi bacterium TSY]